MDRNALYSSIPLDVLTKETRFFHLLPGEDGSEIQTQLFAQSLLSRPKFRALSYAWDHSRRTQTIKINGCSFTVSQDLHHALQALRRRFCTTYPVTLWVDFICINQEDTDEKNTQVPLMSAIYSGASRVIVWLGGASSTDELAMAVMRDLAARGGKEEAVAIGDPSPRRIHELANRLPVGASIQDLLEGLAGIATRSWFRRLWILQEVSLPQRAPLVLCGDWMLCLECFCLGLRYLTWFFTSSLYGANIARSFPELKGPMERFVAASGQPGVQPIEQLRETVKKCRDNGGMPLERALWETTGSLSTDPRDKVYGLLAIAPKAARDQISVDYKRDVKDIFADVVRYSVRNSGGLGILALAGLRKELDPSTWPTWLPRFDRSLRGRWIPTNLTRSSFERGSIYRASRDLPSIFELRDGLRLVVYGIPVDKVAFVDTDSKQKPEGPVQADVASCAAIFSRAARPCGQCDLCGELGAGGADKQGPDTGYESRASVFKFCSKPLYSPEIPEELPDSVRTTTGAEIYVRRGRVSSPAMTPSRWVSTAQGNQSSSLTAPAPPPAKQTVPWGYKIKKPFHSVFWRAFIGDYLADGDGDSGNEDTERVPAPAGAEAQVLKLLRQGIGKNPSPLLRSLLWPDRATEAGKRALEPAQKLTNRLIVSLSMLRVASRRRAFVTAGGWLGFGPPTMEVGDIVVVLAGADVPFVVRPKDGGSDEFLLVGEVYVDGLILGELFDECPAFTGDDEYRIRLRQFCFS